MEAKPKSGLRNIAFVGTAAAVPALTVLRSFAGGFPPNRDGLTPAELAQNYNFLVEYYGKPTYILEEDGSWTAMETRNGAYIVHLPGVERQPLTWETDSAGNVTAVTAARSWDGTGFGEWPGLDMQLLTLAFAAGEGNWLDYWSKLGLLDIVADAGAFSSLSRTAQGVRMDWDTQLEGDVIVADHFVMGEEGAACSGRITLTIRQVSDRTRAEAVREKQPPPGGSALTDLPFGFHIKDIVIHILPRVRRRRLDGKGDRLHLGHRHPPLRENFAPHIIIRGEAGEMHRRPKG